MADDDGDRTRFFPAIERKHGGPITLWIERLKDLGDAKYPEQVAFLRENHAFSQAHANALVMYVRNSPSSKRVKSPDEFFAAMDPTGATTARAIFATITEAHPELELVIAWNQPMLRVAGTKSYVLGLSTTARYMLLNPFSAAVLGAHSEDLAAYKVNKHTVQVPFDWPIDAPLLHRLAEARLAELT
jgi:uncharacterized protein